ncbi:hypothetical protein CVT24_000010 [Panaeolus cyanescens]|uniref:Septin-type G domain-containing protein n=1 Tax=Panaeolus cyanescens TaxID=181874 RepID=A0A409VSA1_9AGAR|nr:hypothetical protein CVT24_000010 [Panaeolus cyanescens]
MGSIPTEPLGEKRKPIKLDALVDLVDAAVPVEPTDVQLDDIIIAVAGPTGAGKTTFIQTIAGRNVEGLNIGHTINTGTTEVAGVKIPIPGTHSNLILIDTPGFDDNKLSDAQTLEIIANWLQSIYRKKVLLTALIYLHRITDVRYDYGIETSMEIFQKLTGPHAFGKVALVTTMWNALSDGKIGHTREGELKTKRWGSMTRKGTVVARFLMGNRDTAVQVIIDMVEKSDRTVLLKLQDELVNRKIRLPETSAGKVAFTLKEAAQWRLRQLRGALDSSGSVNHG